MYVLALSSGASWAIAIIVLAIVAFVVLRAFFGSVAGTPLSAYPAPDPAPRGERCSICAGDISCRLCAKGAPYSPAYCPHRLAGHPQTAGPENEALAPARGFVDPAPTPLAPIADPATYSPEPGRTFDPEEFLADIPTLADEHLEKHIVFAGIEDKPVVVQIPKVAVAIVKRARAKKKKPHGRK